MKAGSASFPFFGIDLQILDPSTGAAATVAEDGSQQGVLAIKKPWPSIARTCYGDHDRYLNTYMR